MIKKSIYTSNTNAFVFDLKPDTGADIFYNIIDTNSARKIGIVNIKTGAVSFPWINGLYLSKESLEDILICVKTIRADYKHQPAKMVLSTDGINRIFQQNKYEIEISENGNDVSFTAKKKGRDFFLKMKLIVLINLVIMNRAQPLTQEEIKPLAIAQLVQMAFYKMHMAGIIQMPEDLSDYSFIIHS